MKTSRTQRLGSEYQKEIAAILSGPLKHKEPELKGLISVTAADVAPDLKTAKIYVSIYTPNEEDRERTFILLKANAGFVRHELAQVMRMRTVPYLTFILDGSMEYGSKMDELFSKLHKD
jgi:ribosome-binding factor A